MDYLKHLSASGQLLFLLEKDTLQLTSAIYRFWKIKLKKKFFLIIVIIYLQNSPEISFHLK